MFQSKALKDFSDEKRSSKLYLWWIDTTLADHYYRLSWKYFGNPIFQAKRLYQWYVNVFQYDYDFDGHCLFAIIEYKLKRIQKSLAKGTSIQDPKDVKALALAVKLAGRLKEDNYDSDAYDRIEKKWGELKTWSEPCNDRKGCSEFKSSWPNVKNEEDKAKCREDRIATYTQADKKCKREERWLYDILHKYLRNCWD